jgi:hypothetical protein
MLNRIIGILQPPREKELTKSAGLWEAGAFAAKKTGWGV